MTTIADVVKTMCAAVAAVARDNGETWKPIAGDATAWDVGSFRVEAGGHKPGQAWGVGHQQQLTAEVAVKLYVQARDEEDDIPAALAEATRVGNAVELHAGYPAGVDAVMVGQAEVTRDAENPSVAEVAIAVTVLYQAAYAA